MKTRQDLLKCFCTDEKVAEKQKYPEISQKFYKELHEIETFMDFYISEAKAAQNIPLTKEEQADYEAKMAELKQECIENAYLLAMVGVLLQHGEKTAHQLYLDYSKDTTVAKPGLSSDFLAQCAFYIKTFFSDFVTSAPDYVYEAMYHEVVDDFVALQTYLSYYCPDKKQAKALFSRIKVLYLFDIANPTFPKEKISNTGSEQQNIYKMGYLRQDAGIITKTFLSMHCKKIEQLYPDKEAIEAHREELLKKGYLKLEIDHVLKTYDLIAQSPREEI